jgi:hypothetical protein
MSGDASSPLSSPVEAVPDDDVSAVLAASIRDGKGGAMTRSAEVFLATACADFLVERLALAGFVVVRRAGT